MSRDHSETGLVVARHRRHLEVELPNGERLSCLVRGRLRALCGDRVRLIRERDGTRIVTETLTRETVLTRIDNRGRPEPIAANLTQLVGVVAATPTPDLTLLDRYLAAAELMQASAVVVHNKCDLAPPPPRFAEYARIGYASVETSVLEGTGLNRLVSLLEGRRSALLGQSGVGKSSLLNALLGDTVQTVGDLGGKGGHGRHTTTTAVLYRLPNGGEILDTPGVRQYAPHIGTAGDVALGFREFAPFRGKCRFDDCIHRAEPDCAVKAAVAAGRISRERYESYLALVALPATL